MLKQNVFLMHHSLGRTCINWSIALSVASCPTQPQLAHWTTPHSPIFRAFQFLCMSLIIISVSFSGLATSIYPLSPSLRTLVPSADFILGEFTAFLPPLPGRIYLSFQISSRVPIFQEAPRVSNNPQCLYSNLQATNKNHIKQVFPADYEPLHGYT